MRTDNDYIRKTDEAIVALFFNSMREMADLCQVQVRYVAYSKDYLKAKRYILDELFHHFAQDLRKLSPHSIYEIDDLLIDKIDRRSKNGAKEILAKQVDLDEVSLFLDRFEEALLHEQQHHHTDGTASARKVKIKDVGAYFKRKGWIQTQSVGDNLRQPINKLLDKYKDGVYTLLQSGSKAKSWREVRRFRSFIRIMKKL